jgi:hypothetical protein
MNKKNSYESLRQSWQKASKELGIEIVFAEEKPIGTKPIYYFAFLPEFGSKSGIYLGIYQKGSDALGSELAEWCESENQRCTFINPESYREFERQSFIDTLLDWGFFGKKLPSWTTKPYVPWS